MGESYFLAPPLFPERSWVDDRARAAAEATIWSHVGSIPQHGTIRALEHWVRGGNFHPYGLTSLAAALERANDDAGEAIRELRENPGELKIDGTLRSGYGAGMWWTIFYIRCGGDLDEHGGCSGYSTPEDAAYNCLSLIEEYEREQYLERLVVGCA